MEQRGRLRRLVDGLRSTLSSLETFAEADDPGIKIEKAVPIALGKIAASRPAWDWVEAQKTAEPISVEPRLTGERYAYISPDKATVLDVIKTASGRDVILDCRRFGNIDMDNWPLSGRRVAAAKFVMAQKAAGEKAWELCPSERIDRENRIQFAKAFQWAFGELESTGIVVKVSGPYVEGASTRWIEVLKDQPTAADVHVDATAQKPKKPTYDEESALIKANQDTPAAQQAHPFQAAEWTHKNGHPRCLLCGDEESVSKQCAGMAARRMKKAEGTAAEGKSSIRVVKRDGKQRIMLGIVHQPGVEDLQGDIISEADIEKAAYQFLKDYKAGKSGLRIDHRRDLAKDEAQLVENYVAPVDFDIPQEDGGREHVIKGSWLQGWELSPSLWAGVEKGEYTGFSMGGFGVQHDLTKEAPSPAPAPANQNVHLTVNVQPSGGATVKREKDGTLTVKPTTADDAGGK
jgi:hypothetical protein